MARRRRAVKREVLPDAKFGDKLITRFMNCLMKRGKKSVAESIVYGALALVGQRKKTDDSLKLFREAIDKVKPFLEVKSRRVGGATYQVPVEVRPERAEALSIRWIIKAARNRNEKTMAERLAGEICDILDNRGGSLKEREDTHRMAEANRAFASYRW